MEAMEVERRREEGEAAAAKAASLLRWPQRRRR